MAKIKKTTDVDKKKKGTAKGKPEAKVKKKPGMYK